MDRQENFEKMKAITVEQLGVDPEKVTENALFIEDLCADSLDLLQLMMALEDAYGITVPDEEFEHINCLADVLDLVEKIG